MTYQIVFEPTAEREMRTIVRWKTQHASPTIAARWYDGLLKQVATLRTLPMQCPVAAENDDFPIEIRELLHGRRRDLFRLIFPVRDDTVFILFVHHGSQDKLEP